MPFRCLDPFACSICRAIVTQVEEIEGSVELAEFTTGPWTLEQFEDFFFSEFNFSHLSMAAAEAVTATVDEGTQAVCQTNKYDKLLGIDMPVLTNPNETVDAKGELDVMAFKSVENYCFEEDPTITIGVVRRGSGEGEISAKWHLENVNVLEESFKEQTGTVVFPDGVKSAEITIDLFDNDVTHHCCHSWLCMCSVLLAGVEFGGTAVGSPH